MRDLLIFAIAFSAAVVAVRHPFVGVLGWTWVSIMNPHRLAWGWMTEFPIAQMLAIGTLAGLIVSRDRKSLPVTPVTVVLALFVVWMLISSAFALYPERIVDQFAKVMKIQLMLFVTLSLIHTERQIRWLVWVTALSLAFFGVKGGAFTILIGGEHRVWGPPGSFIGDNNHVALALAMTIPLLYFLYREVANRWLGWALIVSMGLTAVAVLGTHSRGGLIALASMGVMLWWRSGRRLLLVVPMVVFAVLALSVMPEAWWARMESVATFREDASAMGRLNAWSMAWNLALDRLTGGGFYVFTQELFDRYSMNPEDGVRAAHSIYFQVLGEHGFIGLVLFLAAWALTWRNTLWLRRNAVKLDPKHWAVTLASMGQVSFVGYLVGGAFLSLAYFDLPYLIAVILVATRQLVQRDLKQQSAQTANGAAAPSQTPIESEARS